MNGDWNEREVCNWKISEQSLEACETADSQRDIWDQEARENAFGISNLITLGNLAFSPTISIAYRLYPHPNIMASKHENFRVHFRQIGDLAIATQHTKGSQTVLIPHSSPNYRRNTNHLEKVAKLLNTAPSRVMNGHSDIDGLPRRESGREGTTLHYVKSQSDSLIYCDTLTPFFSQLGISSCFSQLLQQKTR